MSMDVGEVTQGLAALEVVVAYHRNIDLGRASAGIDLFEPDAVFQARGLELVGREAIAGFLADREAQRDRHTVHVLANQVVRQVSTDEIEVLALVLLHVRQPDGSYTLERALDTTHVVRRGPAGWLIHQRLSRPMHPPVAG